MGKTSSQVKNRYNSKAYDRIALSVKKGQRDIIKAYAESNGMSLNGYINNLIRNDMQEHGYQLDDNQSDTQTETTE